MTCSPLRSIPRPAGLTEHIGRQTEHIRGRSGHIGGQSGHIAGSGWTHPRPSSAHAVERRRLTMSGKHPPAPPGSVHGRCLKFAHCLPVVHDVCTIRGSSLSALVPMPCSGPRRRRVSPRRLPRPSPPAALVAPPCLGLCSPQPGSGPNNPPVHPRNPRQTVSRQPLSATQTPRRMISAGFAGGR